jgi:hypothetical protein
MIFKFLYEYYSTPWSGGSVVSLYNNIMSQKLEFGSNDEEKKNPELKEIHKVISSMLAKEEHDRISWESLFSNPLFIDQK